MIHINPAETLEHPLILLNLKFFSSSLPSCCHPPSSHNLLAYILTLLLSRVLVLSLSSVMKIMLLLFLFFLLFLSLTSESPTVTTPSSTVLALMLPLECCRLEVQETGESGGRSLRGGRGWTRKLKEVKIDYQIQVSHHSSLWWILGFFCHSGATR